MEHLAFLRKHIEEIVSLTDEEFEHFSSYFKPKSVKKKDFLITGGKIVYEEYLVVKGCLKSFTEDEMDKQHILQFALEGWWISDFPAHAKQSVATICVTALEDCEVLELTYENREKLCRESHKMEYFFRKKSNAGYVALQKRVLSLLKNSAKEKYELLLQQYPQLFQRVSKTLIASYLGVSRETLSRFHK
jgi:CRP-like cAMP-binding protein